MGVNCKPYFTISKNRELMSKNIEIANTFNYHFRSIVGNLGLDNWSDHLLSLSQNEKHLNIKNIERKLSTIRSFSLQLISENDVKKVIWKLKIDKFVSGGLPVSFLEESEFKFETLTNCMNMEKCLFST